LSIPGVTAVSTGPVFRVPPVRAPAAVARQPDEVEDVSREAPKDRIEVSGPPPKAASATPYRPGSIVSISA